MGEQSRVPSQWQTPPRRYGKITNDQIATIDAAAENFELLCYVGCGVLAMGALIAAAIAWGDELLVAIGIPL